MVMSSEWQRRHDIFVSKLQHDGIDNNEEEKKNTDETGDVYCFGIFM